MSGLCRGTLASFGLAYPVQVRTLDRLYWVQDADLDQVFADQFTFQSTGAVLRQAFAVNFVPLFNSLINGRLGPLTRKNCSGPSRPGDLRPLAGAYTAFDVPKITSSSFPHRIRIIERFDGTAVECNENGFKQGVSYKDEENIADLNRPLNGGFRCLDLVVQNRFPTFFVGKGTLLRPLRVHNKEGSSSHLCKLLPEAPC